MITLFGSKPIFSVNIMQQYPDPVSTGDIQMPGHTLAGLSRLGHFSTATLIDSPCGYVTVALFRTRRRLACSERNSL
jgi:hypothetical protein